MDNHTSKSRLTKDRRSARQQGKPYQTVSGKNVPGKKPPSKNAVCKCTYKCKDLSAEHKEMLFLDLHKLDEKQQGTYLLNRIHMQNISRRRHGHYNEPSESRRQCTFSYVVPDGSGKNVHVCAQTFKNIFGLTPKKLQVLQSKKKEGCFVYEDMRGLNPNSNEHKRKFTDNDRNLVRAHVNSFPRHESHYGRHRSSREYLTPDLNKHRLFQTFKEKYPDSAITYRYYSRVFDKDFPKLKFQRPTVDSCKKCDLFKAKISSATTEQEKSIATRDMEHHHRKSEKAQKCMTEDLKSSQLPTSSFTSFCMDLQQVMFVPMLTHSTMFYSRQLSTYNLGVHIGDTGSSFMCMWHEGIGGRGGNEIASCFFRVVTSGRITKDRLVIWCDNCASQNKNKILLMAIIYLVYKGYFKSIDIKFLVSGHSFMD